MQHEDHYGISVIIPVYQEGKSLVDLVRYLRKKFSGEIIVSRVDTDLETIIPKDDDILIMTSAKKGRAAQMNNAAKIAKGELLLFLHADTYPPLDFFPHIRSLLEEHEAVAGSFKLKIDSNRLIYRLIELGANLRSKYGRLPYGDQSIFVLKSCFQKIGGYKEIALMEDVDLVNRIKKEGKIVFCEDHLSTTSARKWEQDGALKRTALNIFLISCYQIGISPELLARLYYKN